MSKNKFNYFSAFVPTAPKNVKTAKDPKSDEEYKDLVQSVEEIEESIKKSNRDNLDAMYNIDTDNLSPYFKKLLTKFSDGIIEAQTSIEYWSNAQQSGFETIAKWQQEIEAKNYVESKDLDAKIGSYISGEEGTAKIVSAVEGTFLQKDDLNGYVKTTELDAQIGEYINGEEGTASIISTVSGTFVKQETLDNTLSDALENYPTKTEVSKSYSNIIQYVDELNAGLSLSVSNGKESSIISLKNGNITLSSQTIQFTGDVVFKSDLSTAGSTIINGANITTGTISADRIDTSTLRVQEVYYNSGTQYYSIISAEQYANNTKTYIGLKDTVSGYGQWLYLLGTQIFLQTNENATSGLIVDTAKESLYPSIDTGYNLGTDKNYFGRIYATSYYFADGSRLSVSAAGNLRFTDQNGSSHTIVAI